MFRNSITCLDCDKVFYSGQAYERHPCMNPDNEDLHPHKCKHCSYTCQYPAQLVIHERKHTGERPFQCPVCPYAAVSRGNLKLHMRRHEKDDEKRYPFQCEVCKLRLASKYSYRAHLCMHSGNRPFDCAICGTQYATMKDLRAHIIKGHAEGGIARRKKEESRLERGLKERGLRESKVSECCPPLHHYRREFRVDYRGCNPDDGKQCSFVDFIVSVKGGIVFLECDEHEHAFYICDQTRLLRIMEVLKLGGLEQNVQWIRYNPHKFTVDGKKCSIRRKYRVLYIANLLKTMDLTNEQPLTVRYCYYSTEKGVPLVTKHDDYALGPFLIESEPAPLPTILKNKLA